MHVGRFTVAAMLLGSLAIPGVARAQVDATGTPGEQLRNVQLVKQLLASRVHRLGTSAGPDPDTVYVGKSYTNHTGPENYWNIYTGSYLPGLTNATNAVWDWDNTVGIQAADSLQGWCPTSASTTPRAG